MTAITGETRPDVGRISARALFYAAAQQVQTQSITFPEPSAEEVLVRTSWSCVSRGTERLVFQGQVPESEHERMTAPFQEGAFPFPVKYGYAAVGEVEVGPQDLVGKNVFCLFPHQDLFVAPVASVVPLPNDLPPRRAVLAANMETALNGLWDAGAGPGDRIAIVGGGVLGGLLAGICGDLPGADVTLIDVAPQRKSLADRINVTFAAPAEAPSNVDIAFHTSATEAGLATALGCLGREGKLVEMSWFGSGRPSSPLGGAFHSQRLTMISSQVGEVAPSRRPRWSHGRRLAKALELLRNDKYEALLTGEVSFEDLPDAIPRILADGADGLATAVRYR